MISRVRLCDTCKDTVATTTCFVCGDDLCHGCCSARNGARLVLSISLKRASYAQSIIDKESVLANICQRCTHELPTKAFAESDVVKQLVEQIAAIVVEKRLK